MRQRSISHILTQRPVRWRSSRNTRVLVLEAYNPRCGLYGWLRSCCDDDGEPLPCLFGHHFLEVSMVLRGRCGKRDTLNIIAWAQGGHAMGFPEAMLASRWGFRVAISKQDSSLFDLISNSGGNEWEEMAKGKKVAGKKGS